MRQIIEESNFMQYISFKYCTKLHINTLLKAKCSLLLFLFIGCCCLFFCQWLFTSVFALLHITLDTYARHAHTYFNWLLNENQFKYLTGENKMNFTYKILLRWNNAVYCFSVFFLPLFFAALQVYLNGEIVPIFMRRYKTNIFSTILFRKFNLNTNYYFSFSFRLFTVVYSFVCFFFVSKNGRKTRFHFFVVCFSFLRDSDRLNKNDNCLAFVWFSFCRRNKTAE